MTVQEQLDHDLHWYGVCYTYEIEGKVYRLDPRCVRKTEAKSVGEIDAEILKDINNRLNGNSNDGLLPPVQYKPLPL